jgi:hypothetical protein
VAAAALPDVAEGEGGKDRSMQTFLDNILSPMSEAESRRLWDRFGKEVPWCSRRPEEGALPLPWHPRRGISPSPFRYRGVWNWDEAFHAVGAARFDPDLARDQIMILLERQRPSGALPDVIFENGTVVEKSGKRDTGAGIW